MGHESGIIAQPALAPGDVLAGYRVERVLGRGGMGVVYLAEHLHLRRRAALKVIAPELAEAAGFRERFAAEARAAAGLRHPHIVGVYDAGEVDGLLYLAMQHVDGRDLDAYLRDGGPLPLDRVLRLAEQMGDALDAAHAAGLVHRDVKPANILLEGPDAFLGDFGLTKHAADPATGRLTGTATYAAPEQAQGRALDHRTDVYALGAVLHHTLTGAPPFERDSDLAVLYAHVHESPPRVTAARSDLPPAADAVLARALAKDPRDRWASAGGLAAALRTVLGAAGLLEAEPPRVVPREGDDRWTATVVDAPLPVIPSPPQGETARVLVASADPELLALVHVALGSARVRLDELGDATSALARFADRPPALALVDWMLPGGGATVARALHGRGHVVAICDPDRTPRAEALAAGADEVIAAPFSPVQLRVRLRRLLGPDILT